MLSYGYSVTGDLPLKNSFHEFAVMFEEIWEIEANSYFQRVTVRYKIYYESPEVSF